MSAFLGSVEHDFPQVSELETLEDIGREIGGVESFPADVAGPLRVMRFLRGRCGNKTEATELFKQMLYWRAHETRFNVEDLRALVAGMSLEEHQKHYALKAERPFLPSAFLGRSRQGALVVLFKAGLWDANGVLQTFGDNAIMRHEVEKMEWIMWFLHKCCQEEKRVPYLLVLLDLEGASMQQLRGKSRQVFVEFAKSLSAYYIDTVQVTIVLNAPLVFRAVWGLITPFMTERQKAKMRVIGNISDKAFRADLHATVAPEILPASLGGTAVPDLWGQQTRQQSQSASRTGIGEERKTHRGLWTFLSSCCLARGADVNFSDGAPMVAEDARCDSCSAAYNGGARQIQASKNRGYVVSVWILAIGVLLALLDGMRVGSSIS